MKVDTKLVSVNVGLRRVVMSETQETHRLARPAVPFSQQKMQVGHGPIACPFWRPAPISVTLVMSVESTP